MVEDKLNLQFYRGEDVYSDGPVEDEILTLVQENESYEELLQGDYSWGVLYHLSKIRENLLEWYDFNPEGTLLEIGSGCGAITGLFCEKVKKVTAIDLSKKRSTINATRNKNHDNLEIYVGNFEDIKLEEKFDYISLIGVFEYSICYLNSEHPFHDMLTTVKSMLKPGGKLIMAIENKYGLKYWAGAREDHTGKFFDGIGGYHGVERVRTFSRSQIETMLVEAGFHANHFYYPIPDYKMPKEVYSENYLPTSGALRGMTAAYDRDRYELFNEEAVFDELCKDGRFPEFANSFLIFSSEADKASMGGTNE